MRAATAVVAILFVVVLVIDFISFGSGEQAPVDQLVAMSESPAEPQMAPFAAAAPTEPLAETQMVEGEAIEVTRVITEADEMAVEAPAEEAAMADEIAEDEAAEEGEILSPENVTGGGGPAGDEAEAEEPPLALEMAPDNENVAAAPEPELAMAGTTVAARETVTTALTKEALASQPTASPMASLVPPGADGQVASRSAAAGSDAGQLETGFSTGQILAVILGLFLIVLLVLTLLLRRQTR
jgi:hypothetical protein